MGQASMIDPDPHRTEATDGKPAPLVATVGTAGWRRRISMETRMPPGRDGSHLRAEAAA